MRSTRARKLFVTIPVRISGLLAPDGLLRADDGRNSFWLRADNSTTTGWRTSFADTSLPADRLGFHVNPTNWNSLDGFSPLAPINTFFSNVVLDGTVPSRNNIALYSDPNCPTILLDTVTGQRVPHWVELDMSSGTTGVRRAFASTLPLFPSPQTYLILRDRSIDRFMMWPAQKLEFNRRYIVAMRNLQDLRKRPVRTSEAFRSLRDNIQTHDPNIELRRVLFADIFARLTTAGFARNSLQLAWDFTTGSQMSIVGQLLHVRDDGLARLPSSGPAYTITSVKDNYSSDSYRQVIGTMQVPLYLTSAFPGSHLVLDTKPPYLPIFQGWTSAPFEVLISRAAVGNLTSNGKAAPFVHYGHGLFGDMSEIEVGYFQDMANRYGWITAGTDMWGLSEYDVPAVVEMITLDISNFRIVPDRCVQGVLNNLVLTRLLMLSLPKDPNFIFNGKSVIDPTRRFYDGNSQGGIAGNVIMAVSQDLQRGVLGVPGAPYSLLLPRSIDFADLFDIIKVEYGDALERIMLFNVFQLLWDRADPAPFTSSEIKHTLPNTPAKQVVAHYGLGDAQVTWLGALTMGRSIGLKMFAGNVEEVGETLFGYQYINDTVCTSPGGIIQGWKFAGIPAAPPGNIPPPTGDTHEMVRRDPRAQAQINHFYNTGCIKNFCGTTGCQPL